MRDVGIAQTPLPRLAGADPESSSAPQPSGAASSGSAVVTTERTLRRLSVILGLAWLASLVAASFGPLSNISPGIAALALVLNATATVLFALRGRFAPLLLWTLPASALLVILLGGPLPSLVSVPLASYWINLASVTTGLLRTGRRGALAVLALTTGLVAAFTWQQAVVQGLQYEVLPLSLALLVVGCADGLAALTFSGAMRTMASQNDAGAAELQQAMAESAATLGTEQESLRIRRFLHDNVVNTLTAARTAGGLSRDLLRERCRWDLGQLAAADATPAPTLCEVVTRAEERARQCGVELTAECRDARLPADLADALEAALVEGLNNIAKHTRDKRAWLSAEPGQVVLRDAGPGVSRRNLGPGGHRSLVSGCEQAGMTVDIAPIPDEGTRLTFGWQEPAATASPEYDDSLTRVLAQGSLRITLLMSMVGVVRIFSGQSVSLGIFGALALAGLAALLAWGYSASRGYGVIRLPWASYLPITVAMTMLPTLGLTGCAYGGTWGWGPLAGMAATLAVVFIDGRPWAIGAAVAGYTLGMALGVADGARNSAACAHDNLSLLLVDLGVVVAGLLFRRAIERNWRQMATHRARAQEVRLDTAKAEAVQRVRQAHSQQALRVARELLRGLASGRLDPDDDGVRQRCATTEQVLRSLIAVPVGAGPLGEGLAELVAASAATGPVLQLHAVLDDPPGPSTTSQALTRLRNATKQWHPQELATVSVIGSSDRLRIMGSGRVAADWQPNEPGMERVGDSGLLEVEWKSPQT